MLYASMIMKIRKLAYLVILLFLQISTAAFGMPAYEVFNKTNKSIFYVITANKIDNKYKRQAQGTAVAITYNILATNCHVSSSGDYIFISGSDNRLHKATVIEENKNHDICLLKVNDITLLPIKLRPSVDLSLGEDVYAIGNAKGIEKYLSKGIISKIIYTKTGIWILTDVTTAHGSSGGGLFDSEGNLIGLTTEILNDNPNISISTASDWIIQKLNIPPHYSHKSDITSTQTKPTSTDKNETQKNTSQNSQPKNKVFQLLGTYGSDHIKLYRFKNNCFIYIPGRTISAQVISSALWYPSRRTLIFIYPFIKNPQIAVKLISNVSIKFNPKAKKTGSYLILTKEKYHLYRHSYYNFSGKILIGFFEKDPTMKFADENYFYVRINSNDTPGMNGVIHFGLSGFSKALLNYNAKCLDTDSTNPKN